MTVVSQMETLTVEPGAAVTDGIFDQVKHQPIEERVASDYQSASTAIEDDVFMLGKRSKVGEDFFGQGAKLNIVLAGNAVELTHLKQHLGHSRHPLGLFLQQAEQLGCLGVAMWDARRRTVQSAPA